MALSANAIRNYELGEFNDLPVIAADIIYEGAAVGVNAGNARPLVAGDPFAGFAFQKADNAAGAAGDIRVKVRRRGTVELAVTGASAASVGVLAYASDDGTFTTTATANTVIGRIIRHVAGTTVVVEFEEYNA